MVTLYSAKALEAALRFEGVGLLLNGRPVRNDAVLKILAGQSLVPSDLDLRADVSGEVYARMSPTPLHVHLGEPTKERASWRGSWRAHVRGIRR